MSLFDELKKLTRPYSGNEYDEFMDDAPDTPAETRVPQSEPPRRSSAPIDRSNAYSDFEQPRFERSMEQARYDSRSTAQTPVRNRDKVVSLNTPSQVQMVLVKPEFFDAAAEIADHLRERRPVLMNLEKAPKETSRRLIDFLSGVAYALDGKIRRVAANTYIITPYNVDVMGDPMEENPANNNPFM
ncbi:MAG: cell division protein SepF [Clostridia bacterium]|nr:cell division protein SepF [Clostridia bacterium]